jgi:hypothetical protein
VPIDLETGDVVLADGVALADAASAGRGPRDPLIAEPGRYVLERVVSFGTPTRGEPPLSSRVTTLVACADDDALTGHRARWAALVRVARSVKFATLPTLDLASVADAVECHSRAEITR